MGRPKGSRNKTKKAEKAEPVKFTTKADVTPAAPVEKSPVEWKPAPDMGKIKAPADAEKNCAGCPHKAGMHYGREKNWCNVGGCDCQEFSSKERS